MRFKYILLSGVQAPQIHHASAVKSSLWEPRRLSLVKVPRKSKSSPFSYSLFELCGLGPLGGQCPPSFAKPRSTVDCILWQAAWEHIAWLSTSESPTESLGALPFLLPNIVLRVPWLVTLLGLKAGQPSPNTVSGISSPQSTACFLPATGFLSLFAHIVTQLPAVSWGHTCFQLSLLVVFSWP